MANARARELRKSMTPQEVKLWVHLRSWRSRGYHFRRQVPRDGRILDFVCLRRRLILEVDGGQHNFDYHATQDKARDSHFSRQGFKVLRFWNSDVDTNLDGVLEMIDRELAAPPTRPASPATLPRWGRDKKGAA
jgi:very-short-patch-repair endonuclease